MCGGGNPPPKVKYFNFQPPPPPPLKGGGDVVVALVVEVRVIKLVKIVKLVNVYVFDIFMSKKAQNPQFFPFLTWKCTSRHNGVHFFESRHLSLQKWTEHGVFCIF